MTSIASILGLGLRFSSKHNREIIPDDLFTGELVRLFSGENGEKVQALQEWLAGIGVTWSGVPSELASSVANAMRDERDKLEAKAALKAAREELDRAERMLRWPNLAGAEPLKAVIEALRLMPVRK